MRAEWATGVALIVTLLTGCGGDETASGGSTSSGGGESGVGGTGGTSSNAGGGGATGSGGAGGSTLSDGLIHAYKFEQADVLVDHVGTADATSVVVSAFGLQGKFDGAWEFSAATNDHVALVPAMLDGLTAIAVCVWMQFDTVPTDGGLFSWRGEPQGGALLVGGGSYLEWDLNTSITSPSGALVTGTWQLVCGQVLDSTLEGLEIYIDGVKIGDDPGQSSIANAGTDPQVVIGADASFFSSSLTSHFTGLIDEVYIWQRGLSEDEHAALFALNGAAFW